jgi:hypothetical protein
LSHGGLKLLPNPLSTPADYQDFLRHDAAVLQRLGENDYYYQSNYLPSPFDWSPSVRLMKILWRQVYRQAHQPVLRRDGTYNVQSEAYQVTLRILEAFYRKVLDGGALPIVVVFPNAGDLARSRQNRAPAYAPLLDYFRQKDLRFIDAGNAFHMYAPAGGSGALFTGMEHSHFTPAGNLLVAKYIWGRLNEWNLTAAPALKEAVEKERRQLRTH